MRFLNRVSIVFSLVVASLALTWTCYGEEQKISNQQNYERLKHEDLGVEMNERLERSLNNCLKAQEEVKTIAASQETKITQDTNDLWFFSKITKTGGNEVETCIYFWSETGPPRKALKFFYSDHGKMVQGSPGYGIQYDEKGNIIRFQRAPSDGTTLTFYSNGGLRSFRVELAEKKYFEAEWSSEGKLIKEEIGAYPSIYFPQKK